MVQVEDEEQDIVDGGVTVEPVPASVEASYRLREGDVVTIRAEEPEPQAPAAEPEDIPLDILYEDQAVLVLNKPPGLVIHPAAGHASGTLVNALLHHCGGKLARRGGTERLGIVHRLDKDTSGVMVVARSLRAHTSLVDQLQTRTMSRRYRAVATGEIVAGGTVNAPIGRHPRDRKRMAVVHSGKPAVTHYRVLKRYPGATYLEVALESGRTHQIRVHMAHIGHSLAGDPVYGRPLKNRKKIPAELVQRLRSFPRQALHAFQLTLVHPASNQHHTYEAPLPADLQTLLAELDGFIA